MQEWSDTGENALSLENARSRFFDREINRRPDEDDPLASLDPNDREAYNERKQTRDLFIVWSCDAGT